VRRVGALISYPENDPAGQLRAAVFRQGLEKRGWTIGRNLEIDYHWGLGDADWTRSAVQQLLRAVPDVILVNGGQAARAVQRATRTVPVIFIGGGDPVAAGYVQSLARPGGNMTGFTVIEQSPEPKMLELLEEIVPRVSRVAIMFNPDNPDLRQAFDAAAAAKNAVKVVATPVREPAEINAAIAGLGDEPNPGLIVLPDPTTNSQKLIAELAARYHLPAIHAVHAAAADGGLMS